MKKIFILISFIFFLQVNGQEAKQNNYSYSLTQAIDHALQYNYSAINAGKDIEAAKKKKWETTTIGLPQINGNVSYLNNMKMQKNIITVGGESMPLFIGDYNSMDSKLTLSQLIFDGSYLVGLESAKTYLKISENAKQKTNQEIKELTINAYGNVLLAEESILIIEKNKTVLEKNLNDTKQIFKNGFIEEESIEQLQITLASVNSTLSYAKRMKSIASNMLKLLMGVDLESEVVLTDKLDDLTSKNIDLTILSDGFNVENNIDYQIGKNMEESKRLLLKLEKSKALPSLGAEVNFGYNTIASRFGTMFDQKWNNYSNVGVGLNVPIFSSFGRSARTQQAKIALEQSTTELTETSQKLKLQFEKSKSDFEYSIEQYATAKNNLSLAERIEKKQQIKFKEGLSTSFEFTEAQRQLYSTQQSYLQSMIDVINKRAALEKITNKSN
ncbi:TolC family protein [Flavobacterium sp.]|uniref:TolC family protein n=1 Tax=Flavobacterium sp. TaxID=239 RepID=UPI0026368935|nr:TolC family protein [Flavobacterium sp.]